MSGRGTQEALLKGELLALHCQRDLLRILLSRSLQSGTVSLLSLSLPLCLVMRYFCNFTPCRDSRFVPQDTRA